MLVRLLVSVQSTEFALYLMFYLGGMLSIPGALFIALLVRAFVIACMFIIAERGRGERPAEMKLGAMQWVRLVVAEYLSFTAVYLFIMPLERYFAPRGPVAAGGAEHPPVLFIHGYLCNGGYWWAMRRFLARHGVARTYVISCAPLFAPIDRSVEQVAQRIEMICAHAGVDKIILVGHSMGGLIARRYVQLHGPDRVVKIISLESPDHGTLHASLGVSPNAVDMRIGSAFLMALNRDEGQHAPVPTTTVFSYHDNVIAPQESSIVAHAKNIPLKGIGHLEMTFSRPFQKIVLEEIQNAAQG